MRKVFGNFEKRAKSSSLFNEPFIIKSSSFFQQQLKIFLHSDRSSSPSTSTHNSSLSPVSVVTPLLEGGLAPSGTVLLGSNSQVCNLVFGLTALVTQVQLPDLAQESMKVNRDTMAKLCVFEESRKTCEKFRKVFKK